MLLFTEEFLMKTQKTKQLTTLAMMTAMAFVLTVISRAFPPMVLFLKYDPKDVILAIAGFIYGPFAAFIVAFVASFVEMVTVSTTGIIGFFMNVLASIAFVGPAAILYKRNRTLRGAVVGLLLGVIFMTAVMILWNYIITPIYMGVPREQVVALLVPAILPFNLIKGALNAALTMIIYKPIVDVLRKTHLIPQVDPSAKPTHSRLGILLVSVLVIATSILVVMILQGRF